MKSINAQTTDFVKNFAADSGHPNVLVGFADISEMPNAGVDKLPYTKAVSVAVALDPVAVSDLKDGPTASYYDEDNRVNKFLDILDHVLSDFLHQNGHHTQTLDQAYSHLAAQDITADQVYALKHRVIAAHAGLGWIGKSGLIVTKHYGPAVRLTSVLADAPFDCCQEVFLSRCSRCVDCIRACPVNAILNTERNVDLSSSGLVDENACRMASARQSHTTTDVEHHGCGMCIYACPYTQSFLRRNGVK